MVDNETFLKLMFGDQYKRAHVCSFAEDPAHVHRGVWSGGQYGDYNVEDNANNYFVVSLFKEAYRRKSLFEACYVVVLDDVKEKLSEAQAQRLPSPTWVLETSQGSEQWGYKLRTPINDMSKINNLIDGLIESELSPNSKDPGMKGVTRYIRLPVGHNSKSNKIVNGKPFQCRLLEWAPFNSVTLEQLAEPFNIDLDEARDDARVDGAEDVPDHPLLSKLTIHKRLSAGRYEVQCPWVDEHTGGVDNGAAVFTNHDGSLGFKCHHGACENRTGADLMNHLGEDFKSELTQWQASKAFEEVMPPESVQEEQDVDDEDVPSPYDAMLHAIAATPPNKPDYKRLINSFIGEVVKLDQIEKTHWLKRISDVLGWSKRDLHSIVDEYRAKQAENDRDLDYSSFVYVREQNRILTKFNLLLTRDGFHNSFADRDDEAGIKAIMGLIPKVDRMDYAPGEERFFKDDSGARVVNMYRPCKYMNGVKGDISPWWDHFEKLGWLEERDHVVKWMAFTLQHPEKKINHMLVFGGHEGSGKDFLLQPMSRALGDNYTIVDGHELTGGFNDYMMNTKFLHINELQLGDHKEASAIANKLKPIAAAPPVTIRVNLKGQTPIKFRNIVNAIATTNSRQPIKTDGASRRYYSLWSDLSVRGEDGNVKPEWVEYWSRLWTWMEDGGADAVIYHLQNEVDVSQFNPGAPPPITEFQRTIEENGQTEVMRTLNKCIEEEIGVFSRDLLTVDDILGELKNSVFSATQCMYDPNKVTVRKVTNAMNDMNVKQIKVPIDGKRNKLLYVIRNADRWELLTGMSIATEYSKLKKSYIIETGVKAV